MSNVNIKICGIKDFEIANHAIHAGAKYLGFIFYENSHRNISIDKCRGILANIDDKDKPVAVVVNPSFKQLDELARLGFNNIQLHGNENIEFTRKVSENYSFNVIKAFGISSLNDLNKINDYSNFIDSFLLDSGSTVGLPGGTGKTFNWDIISEISLKKNFFLSGGLNIDNIERAILMKKTNYFDVSSGVENSEGIKDKRLITEFINKAKSVL